MELTTLTRQVAALRGRSVADAATDLADLVDHLAAVAADERIADETATNLIARALRAIRPRAPRPAGRHEAVAELRAALAEGPRGPHRAPVGPARTVRAPEAVWAAVDDYAATNGLSGSAAVAELLAKSLGV